MRAAAAIPATSPGLFRTSRRDAALLTLALLQGLGLLTVTLLPTPTGLLQRLSIPLMVAVLLWWDSNTISHNHLHNPLFRAPAHNRAFSLYLSVVLGVPQSLWRARHFWHHAILPPPPPTAQLRRPTAGPWLPVELGLIAALWLLLLTQRPTFFLLSYLPGYLLGLGLCQLQGHYEHAAAAAGVSHYGWLYNWLFFNDGYHAEHHRHPSEHWTRLPQRQLPGAPRSRFPAVFRPLEVLRQQANRAQARLMVLLELLPLRFDWIRPSAPSPCCCSRSRCPPRLRSASSGAAYFRARCWSCNTCCHKRGSRWWRKTARTSGRRKRCCPRPLTGQL